MSFYGILFETPEDRAGDDTLVAPDFFVDLNCDQIVAAITAGREEYNLKPLFHACLRRVAAIEYRHEVMRDLEHAPLNERVGTFAQTMREVRDHLSRAKKLHYKEQRQAWFLDAVEIYCRSIRSFADDLARLELKSRGFLRFRDYLTSYAKSARFNALAAETGNLKSDFAAVDYCLHIKGNGFTVRKYEGESGL